MSGPRLILGTHQPGWLERHIVPPAVPMMVSHRRLRDRVTFPAAQGPWVLDSGGFTQLSLHGEWGPRNLPGMYARYVRRYATYIERLEWCAPQDWMCEPEMLARTGLTVAEHQARTVGNYLELRAVAPDLPWLPVLQGWTLADYERCLELYRAAGIDLTRAPLVGLGSVCRRQATREIEQIVRRLAGYGVRLHGFGIKASGLTRYGDALVSADSMAWSFAARRSAPLPGCEAFHLNCANCPRYAVRWHTGIVRRLESAPRQLRLDLAS